MAKKKQPPNKPQSPYDFGKKLRPPTAQETARVESNRNEQMSLRGCGDPDCVFCNPESANARKRRERVSGTFVSLEELYRNLTDDSNNSPSAEYKKAREAVADWLLEDLSEVGFDDIVGNEEAFQQLRSALEAPVKEKELYEHYNLKPPKGALLTGPPGCGKTMFAKAAAWFMKDLYSGPGEMIAISGAELQSMYVGQTEGYITAIFAYARAYKKHHGHPLLVFIDEAEVILPDRTGRVRRAAPWEESQVATFLAELDGIKDNGAFLLLASNRPEVIDEAVLREGRCDFKIAVKRPERKALTVIIERAFKTLPLQDKLDDLVVTAVECFYNPHYVIKQGQFFLTDGKQVHDKRLVDFCLEHIVSGAMAVALPTRAARIAYERDKAASTITGITTADVMKAVGQIHEENKNMSHSFAEQEFAEMYSEIFSAETEAKEAGIKKH